jgi:ABC-type uncharacterized transport system substrate-binding protein
MGVMFGLAQRAGIAGLRGTLIVAGAAGLATPAAAHPHVFVTAGVEIVFDDAGRMEGVRLSWTYDEFFSFMLTEDLGLDADGDLVMTPEEHEALARGVLDWPADFGGDLFVSRGGEPVALGQREQASVDYVDGLVTEHHYRPLAAPVEVDGPVNVQVYDPFYYVAYEIAPDIVLHGAGGCAADLRKADLNAAYSLVDELLYGRPASDVGPEEAFPEVGEAFADTVVVTCGG